MYVFGGFKYSWKLERKEWKGKRVEISSWKWFGVLVFLLFGKTVTQVFAIQMQNFLMLAWEKEETKETGRNESETTLFLRFLSLKLILQW